MIETNSSSEACYEVIDKIIEKSGSGCVCEIDISKLSQVESIIKKRIE